MKMNFEGWTVTEATHGMDCHKCEWAAGEAVDLALETNATRATYTINATRAVHAATVTRDNEEGTR
jgi:hypothetical protein